MSLLVEIGKRLKSERERLGLKAVEVYDHDQINIAQTTYKNYEEGRRDAPTSLLTKLWDLGFDVMYVATGVYSDDFVNSQGYQAGFSDTTKCEHRLTHLPLEIDINSPADQFLTAMYHVEDALIQTGAVANKDYDYKDIGMMAVGLMDKVK